MLSFLARVAIVGIGHVVLGVALYYARIHRLSSIVHSDVLVFLLPTVLAFSGYFLLAWHDILSTHRFAVRLLFASLIAIVAVVVSCFCFAMVAFNTWGK
jgi:hypothetical protein